MSINIQNLRTIGLRQNDSQITLEDNELKLVFSLCMIGWRIVGDT